MLKVAIIGAGASGLITAKQIEDKFDVTIFEMNKKIGSKVLASGNGRCNLSNLNIHNHFFNAPEVNFKEFLKKNNLETITDNEGRMYPVSNSSKSVLDLITPTKAKIYLETPVLKINKINSKYKINDIDELFDYLILATGSIAGIHKSKTDYVYSYLKSLNIKLNVIKPSLVGFKLKHINKSFSNIRCKANVSLLKDNNVIKSELGEVIFKEDGISGIVIFNLSYYYNKYYSDKSKFLLSLNLYPELKIRDFDYLKYNINPNLYEELKKSEKSIDLTYEIISCYDFEAAQNSYGGISLDLVDSNLRLKADQNIFIAGELLDVTYPCGGFNLDFAFNSGLKISEILKGILL